MPTYVFIIDNKREDGYYHYRRYAPGTELDKNGNLKNKSDYIIGRGWSLCSKQDDENRESWIKGVNFYLKRTNTITHKDTILGSINDMKMLLLADDKKFPENRSLVMPQISSVMKIINEMNVKECDDDFITKISSLGTMELPTPKAKFKYAWLSTKYNLNNEIDKAIYSLNKTVAKTFLLPVLDAGYTLINTYFDTVDTTYIEIKRICNKCVRIWNTCKSVSDKQIRKKLLKDFTDECVTLSKKYGKWILDVLYEILCIDVLVKVFKALKNLRNYSKNTWKSLMRELRALCDALLDEFISLCSDKAKNINKAIYAFIPLLSTLLGALYASKCADEELKVKDQARICAGKADNVVDLTNKILSNTSSDEKTSDAIDDENIQAGKILNSNVLYYAKHDTNKFSLKHSSNHTTEPEQEPTLEQPHEMQMCKVSICDDYWPNDSGIVDTQIFLDSSKICIEIDNSIPHTLNVSKGQFVKINDLIGTINGVGIKSINNIDIEEVKDNYIIGKYHIDETLNDLQNDNIETLAGEYFNKQLSSFDDKELQRVQKRMLSEYNLDNFIINYLSYFRYPDFATYTREHTNGNAIAVSTQEFVEIYEKQINVLYEDFTSRMKMIAGKDNVKAKSEQGRLITLQNEIRECKNDYIDSVLKMYNENPGNLKYCSLGRISDFSLHDLYVNYINDFDYDENNEYVVKLFDLVNSFIARRKRIEINSSNVEALIISFNETCEKYIKKYWQKTNDENYYKEFSKLFKNDIILISTKPNETTSSSLYKKVLDYLKSLTKCTPSKEYQISVDDIGSYDEFIKKQTSTSINDSYDESQMELLKHLKNISMRFTSIKEIEISYESIDISKYFSENSIDYEALDNISYKDLNEYYNGKIYSIEEGVNLLGQENILGGYLKTLKEITDDESRQMTSLLKSIILEHAKSDSSLDSYINEFHNILGVSWPLPSSIYHDDIKCDFYFFNSSSIPVSDSKDLLNIENEVVEDIKKPLPDNIEYDPSFYYAKKKHELDIDVDELSSESPGIDSLKYWLRYCSLATVYHAMLPVFWSTGLVMSGTPVLMPVVYVPLQIISGKRVITVCGLGVCGICPLPMLLFLNLSQTKMSLIPPVNTMIDALFESIKHLTNVPVRQIELSTKSLIDAIDSEIASCRRNRKDLDFQISEIKKLPKPATMIRDLGLSMNNDVSFKREKNENEFLYPDSTIYDMSEYSLPEGGDPFDEDLYNAAADELVEELKNMKFEFYTQAYYDRISRESDEAKIRKAMEEENNQGNQNDSYDDGNGSGYYETSWSKTVTVTVSGNYPRAYAIWKEWCISWEGLGQMKEDVAGATYKGIVYNNGLYDSYRKLKNIRTKLSFKQMKYQIDHEGLWDKIAFTTTWQNTNIEKIKNIWIAIMIAMSYWHMPAYSLIRYLNNKFAHNDSKILLQKTINKINGLHATKSETLFNEIHEYWRNFYINNVPANVYGDKHIYFSKSKEGLIRRTDSVQYGYVVTNNNRKLL